MANSSHTYKMGETCDTSGSYECLGCKYTGNESLVRVEKGKILPMCSTCKDQDTTWHLKKAS